MKLTKKGTKNNSKIWKFFERKTGKKDNKYEIKICLKNINKN